MEKLYRILLVDDEEEVRTSIIRKLDWEKTGFVVAGDAENGEDALEKIEQLQPDLVLTDIRMPYMDGLALAEALHQIYPSMKVVIFSGYDDFEYAKQAIKLNILEYILKPVNAEELTEILGRIKARLDAETAQLRDMHTLRESFAKSLPILRENFLNNLIRSAVPSQHIPALLREYRLELGGASLWTVAKVSIERPPEAAGEGGPGRGEEGLVSLSVKRLIDTYLNGRCSFASFHSSTGLCVVIGLDSRREFTTVMALLNEICRESAALLELRLTIGLGRLCGSLAHLEESYRQAGEAAGYRAFEDAGDVIFIGDVQPGEGDALSFDGKDESDLTAALRSGEPEKLESCIGELVGRMKAARFHDSRCQAYIISIFSALLQMTQRYELDAREVFGGGDYYRMLLELRDAEGLGRWLGEVCPRISGGLTRERRNSAQNVVREARCYMQEHFGDPELSLESVCSHLHMSAAYFSTLFKREAGESFTACLTRMRMERAAELLTSTDEKTYQIAREVGYYEPNYFGYVFKKTYGLSPNRYRGR